MAITPYSTPTQYQYKPLNLMAFAEPLMKMQEKYDLTKAAIEDSDVSMSALQYGKDRQKAEELKNVYRQKRDELVANLLETSNYTQAASKLKQLNKLWTEDPERIAIESNYKTFLERDKEELARVGVGEGKITKQQYLQWRADEIRKFDEAGGTNFRNDKDTPGGTTYNTVTGTIGRTADMSKEMQELMFKAADAIQAKKYTGAMQALGIDPVVGDAKFKISDYENLSRAEIEAKVEQYIKQQDRFKPWLIEKADYDFKDVVYAKDGGAKYNQVATNLLQQNYAANEQYIQKAEKDKKAKSKDFNEEDYKKALLNRDFLLEQMDNPNQDVIRDLFVQNEMNRQYDASALGKIFEVNNSKTSYTFRDLPQSGTGTGTGSDFSLDGLGRAAATTKELVSSDLRGIKGTATNNMLKSLKANNEIAGGNARYIVAGDPGSAFRTQMENAPAKQFARQQQMLAIFQESKSPQEFYNKLKTSGFNSGNTLERATAVYKSLANEETSRTYASRLNKMEGDYNNYLDADSQLANANNAAFAQNSSLPEFKRTVEGLDASKDKRPVSAAAVVRLAKQRNTTVEKLIESGVVSHSAAQGNQAGVVTPESFSMSPKNIAKAYGYKSVQDAVQKGFDFTKAGASYIQNTIDQSRDKSFRTNYQGNEMGFRLVGDPKVDKSLSNELLTVADLNGFMPVEAKSWNSIPGFDSEGRLMPGTKLLEGKTPKLLTQGNQVFLEIPYTYKNEDGKEMQRSIKVRPKPEQRVYFSEILRKVAVDNYQIKDTNPAAAQNFDTFAVALFNNQTQSKITRQSADAAEVSKTNKYVVLERVPMGKGATIQIRKVYQGEDADPIYTAYIVDANGGLRDSGIKSYDIDAVKSGLTEQLYLK